MVPLTRTRAAIAALLFLIGVQAGCKSDIAGKLDDEQSREVMAALGRSGIPAHREASADGTFSVGVPAADAARALAALEAEGLPRAHRPGLESLYAQASMIPSPVEEKARFINALSAEIARHLEQLDDVLDASVIITAPEKDPLAPADAVQPRATASVLLTVRSSGLVTQEEQLRHLVAGAAEDLAPADVAIVVAKAPPAPEGGGAPALTSVGPIDVPHSSKTPLQIAFAIALLLIVGLGSWAFVSERRRTELRARLDALERQARTGPRA